MHRASSEHALPECNLTFLGRKPNLECARESGSSVRHMGQSKPRAVQPGQPRGIPDLGDEAGNGLKTVISEEMKINGNTWTRK